MADRQLKIVVSADIHQYQQAMTLAASSAHGFQQSLGAAGQSMHGFQQASSQAGSAASSVGHSQQQAAGQVASANSQISSSNDKTGASFGTMIKRAVAVVGVGAALKSTVKAGMDFQSSLNTLGAVSGATSAQMKKVGDTARSLGNDISIPGASAADAAAAMTELAKGGLNVAQSMAAAKGTLQLAAAAQIDGAQAAEIQAKAINTFGLAGKDASHVGDVLANTANAASGEITDFAAALAQGGLVAHSMGVSIDDTSTALGIFANQGLVGSDAGTSLKSMLVALQSPTKQQAAALKTLGVAAFDAQGNFVGMRTITDQLSTAQANLTQQQFSAAASTAFGTDAVRASIAVAAGGTDAWDNMSKSVSKSGGAAELAAAQTKGLQGAFGLVQNAVQDAQISLMQQLSPALEGATRSFADMIPQLADSLVPALGTMGQAVVGVAQTALPLLASAAAAIGPLFTSAASGVSAIMPMLNVVVGVVGTISKVFAAMPAPVHAAVLAMLLIRTVRGPLSAVGTAAGTTGTKFALMGRQIQFLKFQGMGAGLATMKVGLRGIGTAAASAGNGLKAAFGGWLGIALIGITTVMSLFASGNEESAAKVEKHKEKISELADTMDKATGAITDASKESIRADFGDVADSFSKVGLDAGAAANAIIAMSTDGGKAAQAFREKIVAGLDISDIGKRLSHSGTQYIDEFAASTGVAQEDILRLVANGGAGLDAFSAKLLAAGYAPQRVADGMNRLRGDVENVSGVFSAFTGKQDQQQQALGQTADHIETTRRSYADLAKVNFDTLNKALTDAATNGGSLESALYAVGLNDKAPEIIKKMGADAVVGANGMHYLTQEAADAATAVTGAGAGAKGAAGGVKLLNDKVKDATPAVGSFAEAMANAKAPAGGLKSALDGVKAAADNVSTASDLMAAAVLRAAGIDLTAEQAARENAAALRGITEGIYEKTRAGEDDKKATADRTQATKDLTDAQNAGAKVDKDNHDNDETAAEFAARIADLTDKKAAAIRKEQDAHLANQKAQTADREGMTKAAQSALDVANAAGLAALATGSVKDAAKAAGVEFGKQREDMIKARMATGETRKEAEKYVAQLKLTPAKVSTQFEALIANAEKNGTHLYKVYDSTNKTWTAQFLTKDEVANLKAKDLVKLYGSTTKTWSATLSADNAKALDAFEATQKAAESLPNVDRKVTYSGVVVTDVGKGVGKSVDIHAATGGLIRGPGTGTSDSIATWLSDKEFVVNAKATAANLPLLHAINNGTPAFAGGGLVGNHQMVKYGITGSTEGAPDWAAIAEAGVTGLAKAAGEALKKLVPPIPAGNYAGVSQWLPLAQKVFAAKGAPMAALPIMMEQMKHESSGNPAAINLTDINAQNGTPSKGLLQFIAPTFRAYADPGYNSNIWDPESQMRAFINYVPSHYGSFSYLTRIGNKAYADGGPVSAPGGSTADGGLARVSNGEFIVNAASTARNFDLLHAINSGMPGFASGGLVGVGPLSGSGSRTPGTREGIVSGALADILSFVRDAQAQTRDLLNTAKESARAYRSARDGATNAAHASAVARIQARGEGVSKIAQAEANLKSAKTTAEKVTRERALNKVRAEAVATNNRAIDAEKRVNAEQGKKVAAATRQAVADSSAARAAQARSTAEAQAYQATARARASQVAHARALDVDTTALSANKEKLASLKADRASAISGLAGSLIGNGSGLTGFASERNTPAAILKGLQFDLSSGKAYGANLAKLEKGGLSNASIQDLIGKGTDGVLTAATLAKASPGTLKAINSIQSQIVAQANSIATRAVSPQTDRTIAALASQVQAQGRDIRFLVKSLQDNGVQMVRAMQDAAAAPMKAVAHKVAVKAGQH